MISVADGSNETIRIRQVYLRRLSTPYSGPESTGARHGAGRLSKEVEDQAGLAALTLARAASLSVNQRALISV
jgi:hypothetical protein